MSGFDDDDGRRRPGPPTGADDDDLDPYDYERIFYDDGPAPSAKAHLVDSIYSRKKYFAVAAGLLVVWLLVTFVMHRFDPAGSPKQEVTIQVAGGTSLSSLAGQLDDKGVVPSAIALRIWAKIDGGVQFQAGEYVFHRNSSAGQALAVLRTGPKQRTDRLTIPEGYRVEQIAQKVGSLPGMSATRFMEVVNGGTIRSTYQPQNSTSMEGLLFPDTYLLSDSDNEETLLRRMVQQFDAKARVTGLLDSQRTIGQTPYETLVIASLIEAEAKVDEDRGKISQVIQNRLFDAEKLQIDATVLYALGNKKTSLSRSDLNVDSVYNTYRVQGLPPTPIGNPGAKSIEAALRPTPGAWKYYVVTDESGRHAFAETYEEHLRNIEDSQARGVID
jgi:UPF0755 protein